MEKNMDDPIQQEIEQIVALRLGGMLIDNIAFEVRLRHLRQELETIKQQIESDIEINEDE